MLDALRPQLIDIVNSDLDYSSAENFYQSWVLAIQTNTQFRHTIANMESLVSKEMGLSGLIKLIDDDPKQSEKYIYGNWLWCYQYCKLQLGCLHGSHVGDFNEQN